MDLLQQARAEIDMVDAEMAALFERRMCAVADVARYKAETGKPVFDAAREAAVLDKNTARIADETLRPYYRAFLNDAMAVSRAYQRAQLGRDTAAYQGVPGAWSHITLRRLFPFARESAFATWGEVFDAVQKGDAQFGVLPFENSSAGRCFHRAGPAVHPPRNHRFQNVRYAHPARPGSCARRGDGDDQDRCQPPAGSGPKQRFCAAARL